MRGIGRIALPAVVVVAAVLAGCSAPGAEPTPGADASPEVSAAEAYCADQGGTVQSRQPTYGTNDDRSAWIELGDPLKVCRFQTLGDEADSRIYLDLVTLYSEQPTLAALAYLSRTPLPADLQGNPASELCVSLGGAVSYGSSPSGGGMVNVVDPDDQVFAACVFADGSFIEEWGIAYYSDGTVRGKDLTEVFRFDQSDLPPVF